MIIAMPSVEDRETIRWIFGCFVQEVYDDPSAIDYDPLELAKLERAGRSIGVDIWDRDLIRQLSGFSIGDVAYERLCEVSRR
jgi:hypothetical protein